MLSMTGSALPRRRKEMVGLDEGGGRSRVGASEWRRGKSGWGGGGELDICDFSLGSKTRSRIVAPHMFQLLLLLLASFLPRHSFQESVVISSSHIF